LVVTQHQTNGHSNVIALNPSDIFFNVSEEPPEEIYEPTTEDEAFLDEVYEEQQESELAQQNSNNGNGHDASNIHYLADYRVSPDSLNGNGHHTNGYHEPTEEELEFLKLQEADFKAEQILEQAGQVFANLKYVYFTSRSKGRRYAHKKGLKVWTGQQTPRRNWKEVELVSRGSEPRNYIGRSFRHRTFWPSDRFPWDEVADGMGIEEGKLMELLPTLAHNAKQARGYLRAGRTPDYRNLGIVNY
ncbi:MAG: hypothetical protein HY515_05035, partial [Candidatus Aenigmarchaeota archaeon]|nr:hypothetical protein [Candidatus Aenigmarchaeota archaeon]